jgi:hypothetical protein
VYKKQSRPVFPSGVPALYSNLARQCWETDVHLRPSFAQIRKELQVGGSFSSCSLWPGKQFGQQPVGLIKQLGRMQSWREGLGHQAMLLFPIAVCIAKGKLDVWGE